MHTHTHERLPFLKQMAYIAGEFGWSTLINIVSFSLVYFYLPPLHAEIPLYISQTTFFVVLNIITLIAASGRFWDAFLDPLVANWSDRFKHKRGRRIPFLFMGAFPAAFFCALLFFPLFQEESHYNIIWLIVIQLLFYIFFTMYTTPYQALLAEMVHTPEQRLNMSTWMSAAYNMGILVGSATPQLAVHFQDRFGHTKIEAFQFSVSAICVFAAILMILPVIFIDEKRYCNSVPTNVPVIAALKRCLKNEYFVCYIIAEFAFFVCLALVQAGMLYYITVLLQLKEELLLTSMAILLVVSSALYPLVNYLAKKQGMRRGILFAFTIFSILFSVIFFAGRIPIDPLWQLLWISVFAAVPMSFLGVLPIALLANIAEGDALKTGVRQEGMFFAARTMLQKLGQTVGIILFAGLTNFGKEVGDDWGIRMSGIIGVLLSLLALFAFRYFKEDKLLKELKDLEDQNDILETVEIR